MMVLRFLCAFIFIIIGFVLASRGDVVLYAVSIGINVIGVALFIDAMNKGK